MWPEIGEQLALYNLRRELSRLRRALGLHADRLRPPAARVLALELSGITPDVIAFDEAIARGDEPSLRRAAALYTGPLLEDCGEPWVIELREARAQAWLVALETLAARELERGQAVEAIRLLRLAVMADPLRESAQRRLLEAQAAAGEYAAATRTYRDLRLTLERELQTEPAPETRALHEGIVARARVRAATPKPAGVSSAVSPPARTRLAPAPSRPRLPRPLTRLVGRTGEIGDIAVRLRTSRLVTLVGAGGAGKSRLAIEAADIVASDFPDGIWFVELAAQTDPALVASTVAGVLGVRGPSLRPVAEVLGEFLRDQRALLVIDNCEHLVAACAELTEGLLANCAELRVLANGRQALGLVGEVVWRVPSLAEPEAVQLFLERADDARPGAPVRGDLDAVSLVCRRLDGIPLAIELAAARMSSLSVDQIAARLDDRFLLLTAGSRAALARHQTLFAAIEWSYHLLTEGEQALLRHLAVFAGGWILEGAEQVWRGEVLKPLTGLVEKSLVVFDSTRYRMLETIREHARAKLAASGEQNEACDRHLAFMVRWAEEAAPHIFGGEQDKAWLGRVEQEHDNIRVAFDWAEAGAGGAGGRSGAAAGGGDHLVLVRAKPRRRGPAARDGGASAGAAGAGGSARAGAGGVRLSRHVGRRLCCDAGAARRGAGAGRADRRRVAARVRIVRAGRAGRVPRSARGGALDARAVSGGGAGDLRPGSNDVHPLLVRHRR